MSDMTARTFANTRDGSQVFIEDADLQLVQRGVGPVKTARFVRAAFDGVVVYQRDQSHYWLIGRGMTMGPISPIPGNLKNTTQLGLSGAGTLTPHLLSACFTILTDRRIRAERA